ncbi:MAG: MotB family protein [Chromatiales bacterium]|nr:MotB family protein [Chromatiales bacterium]
MSEVYECECEEQECEAGAPAWVMTFADLMSLLMCFFVLLLSFSEMDVIKFKQIAGSFKMAFGVQRQVEAPDIPLGTSIIAQEFSPGKTEPTPVDDVRQITSKEDVSLETAKEVLEQAAKEMASDLQVKMAEQIDQGLVEVESQQDKIVIRIKEKGSFPSGSADLHDEFLPTLEVIRQQVAETPGTITVAGHTDDIPINTFRFRSNWELSSSRAVSVLEQLLADGTIKPEDTEVKGLADTRPLLPNDSWENRAANRRVEIIISPTMEPVSDDKGAVLPQEVPELMSAVPTTSAEPVVIQDDSESPVLQPELTGEIEALFRNQGSDQ